MYSVNYSQAVVAVAQTLAHTLLLTHGVLTCMVNCVSANKGSGLFMCYEIIHKGHCRYLL